MIQEVNMSKVILFLAAHPRSTPQLRLDEEVREIDEGLKRSLHRDQFTLRQKWAVRPEDLRRAMLEEEPQIVHFAGHGAGEQGIMLEDALGYPHPVTAEALQSLFALFPMVECVVLNACYAAVQAKAICKTIPYVVGMSQAIGDRAAIVFATAFYDTVANGRSFDFAFKVACNALQLEGIPEHLVPVLKMNCAEEVGAGGL
jgi:hypothetical protein